MMALTYAGAAMVEPTPTYVLRQMRDAKRTVKLAKRQARRVEKRQLKLERRSGR
jgi:hypothetical protein